MRKRKEQQVIDVLQQKERRLKMLAAESDFYVSRVRTTIDNLEEVNADIEQTVADVDSYIERLTATKEGLEKTRDKNTQVAKNFKQLLCIE